MLAGSAKFVHFTIIGVHRHNDCEVYKFDLSSSINDDSNLCVNGLLQTSPKLNECNYVPMLVQVVPRMRRLRRTVTSANRHLE